MGVLRVLIADDEPLARQRMRTLAVREPEVEVVGECATGRAAAEALRARAADVAFLDVEMPDGDGFDVIREVGPARMPAVVFVTAYDRYALRAFEVHAVDYLLKPFDGARFREALRRARARAEGSSPERAQRLRDLVRELGGTAPAERLVVRSASRVVLVPVDEIDYAEACGNYVRLHCRDARHLMRETMNGLESRLDRRRFARIHRSLLVNLDRVQELHPLFHGDWAVILRGGARLTLSRNYRDRVPQLTAGRP
jgi:two-component system, LytTR family, response regulator